MRCSSCIVDWDLGLVTPLPFPYCRAFQCPVPSALTLETRPPFVALPSLRILVGPVGGDRSGHTDGRNVDPSIVVQHGHSKARVSCIEACLKLAMGPNVTSVKCATTAPPLALSLGLQFVDNSAIPLRSPCRSDRHYHLQPMRNHAVTYLLGHTVIISASLVPLREIKTTTALSKPCSHPAYFRPTSRNHPSSQSHIAHIANLRRSLRCTSHPASCTFFASSDEEAEADAQMHGCNTPILTMLID